MERSFFISGTSYNNHKYGGKYGYYDHGVAGTILAGRRWYNPYLILCEKNFPKPIGTKGETINRLAVKPNGEGVTSFPVKNYKGFPVTLIPLLDYLEEFFNPIFGGDLE